MLIKTTAVPGGSQLFDANGNQIVWRRGKVYYDEHVDQDADVTPGIYWEIEADLLELRVSKWTVTESKAESVCWSKDRRGFPTPADFPDWLRKQLHIGFWFRPKWRIL